MIIGIGIDIVPVAMITESIARKRFIPKTFTLKETIFCCEAPHPSKEFAKKFAIKEACMKALGMGIQQGVWFTQIESYLGGYGSIRLRVYRMAKDIFEARNVLQSHVRIAGTSDLVFVMVTLDGENTSN